MKGLLLTLVFLLIATTTFAQGNTYSTTFPLTENPVSEGHKWINGGTCADSSLCVGLDWKNVQTTPHFAFGTQTGNGTSFDDSTAVLAGSWGPNQTVIATVFQNNAAEMEIRLHTTITAHSITGYEILCVGGPVMQVVRWEGPFGSFNLLATGSTPCAPNDVFKGTIINNSNGSVTITGFINGTQAIQVTDTGSFGPVFRTGNPGMGFFNDSGLPVTSNGFVNFYATDGPAWTGVVAPSRSIDWAGGAGLPSVLLTGEVTVNPWTPPTRTQCGSTINPSGDQFTGTDVVNIEAAILACTAEHFVLLAPGTFYITNHGNCFGGSTTCLAFFNPATGTSPVNGVTLRGSGAQSTILTLAGNSLITTTVSSNNGNCSWTGGLSSGSTTVTTASCSGPTLVANELVTLNQCDTGWSGATCSTGSSADNGGLFVCKNNVGASCADQNLGGTNNMQRQVVLVTKVSGSTVNVFPPVYMPNWSSARTPVIIWPSLQTHSDAVEDLTVYAPTGSTSTYLVNMGTSYGSWVKGVRFLGSGNNAPFGIQGSKNILFMNNYLFSDIAIDANFPPPTQTDTSSDVLILNNIMASSVPWEGNGGDSGVVLAYNYGRDCFTAYMEDIIFDHTGGSMFYLFEGNQFGGILDDNTWATKDLNTWFRNYTPGWDVPYVQQHPRGLMIDAFHRFDNLIGNSIGSQYITTYQTNTPGTGDNSAFRFNGSTLSDSLTLSSSMRWGNCDTATNTCRFQSSEVPTTLSGNATPFQNTVPANNNLPCSFVLTGYTATTCTPFLSGGTGLNWWKVCTSWTVFPTSCSITQTPPFPTAGPDVVSGPFVNGHAYDNPAAIAFKNLPVDPAYQQSFAITSSSWSAGTETLTVTGLPNTTHLMGPFQVPSGACSTLSSVNGEAYITGSTATTISYALASNPGSCAGGTFKFPDVRKFDERVFQLDSGSSGAPIVSLSTSLLAFNNLGINLTSAPKTVTLTNTGTAILGISSITLTTGTVFTISANTCSATLGVGLSCSVSVIFKPLVVGAASDTLVFTTTASSSPDNVSITGTGVFPTTPSVQMSFLKEFYGFPDSRP